MYFLINLALLSLALLGITSAQEMVVGDSSMCGMVEQGSNRKLTLTHCRPESVCTQQNPTCTGGECAKLCVARKRCSSTAPCSDGFKCNLELVPKNSTKSVKDGEGVCDHLPQHSSPNATEPVGRRCGMDFPLCQNPLHECSAVERGCESTDVCRSICKKRL